METQKSPKRQLCILVSRDSGWLELIGDTASERPGLVPRQYAKDVL